MGIKRLEKFLFQLSIVQLLPQNAENMKTDIIRILYSP